MELPVAKQEHTQNKKLNNIHHGMFARNPCIYLLSLLNIIKRKVFTGQDAIYYGYCNFHAALRPAVKTILDVIIDDGNMAVSALKNESRGKVPVVTKVKSYYPCFY